MSTVATTPTPTPTAPSRIQWTILLAYIINTFGTFWSMTGKWTDGCTNSNQSDKYFTLITPPGWAFAIWGLIFAWEGVACLVAFLPKFNSLTGTIVGNTFTGFWTLACLTQAVWPYIFCGQVILSWVVLLVVWTGLVGLQQSSLAKLATLPSTTSKVWPYLLLIAPFSLHLGWVTAAAALNFNVSVVAASNSDTALISVAVCTVIFVAIMGWTLGVTGLSWTKNSCDPAMAAGVLWAINAVSHHDTSKLIKTSTGPTVFPVMVTSTLTNVAVFVFWFLAACLLLRLQAEGILTLRRAVRARRSGNPQQERADASASNHQGKVHEQLQCDDPLLA